MAYQALGLDGAILQELNLKAKEHGIELVNDDIKSAFNELLEKVSQKHGKVALLIDEYDKPIIDYLAPRLCNNNRLYTGGIRISF